MTFHKILAGCQEGDRAAWKAFLADYTPIALRLFSLYLPLNPVGQTDFWREALVALCADNYQALQGFEDQAEREFLVDLRAFLLDRALPNLDPSQDSTAVTRPTVGTVTALLKGLPLLHQEIIFLTLAGYSLARLEKMLRITPTVAQEGLKRLEADFAAALNRSEDKCLWPAAWLEVTRSARASPTESCAPLRQLVRILDGQASWYDKSPVEEHRSTCLHCLENWTALLEVVGWEREAKPLSLDEIKPLLACLPIQPIEKSGKSLLARILGK